MKLFELLSEDTTIPNTGYHGTVKTNRGKFIFDEKRIHPTDQFLGKGFYFTIDRSIAQEYANMRAIKLATILPREHPKNTGGQTFYKTTDGEFVSTESVMKGIDLDGNPIQRGQEILEVDLSGLEKTYFIKNNNEIQMVIKSAEKLKAQGYDSIAFEGFSDRSKQIMVFPEHINKVSVISRT